MLVYRTTVYLFSIVVQVSCNFSGTYLHALLSMKEISHYLIIMATEMLWFSVILGSIFIFLCFVLTIIHCHTQEQNKSKIEPRIRLSYDMNNSFCTQCFHFFRLDIVASEYCIFYGLFYETVFLTRKVKKRATTALFLYDQSLLS